MNTIYQISITPIYVDLTITFPSTSSQMHRSMQSLRASDGKLQENCMLTRARVQFKDAQLFFYRYFYFSRYVEPCHHLLHVYRTAEHSTEASVSLPPATLFVMFVRIPASTNGVYPNVPVALIDLPSLDYERHQATSILMSCQRRLVGKEIATL